MRLDRALALLVPALLVAVAVNQLFLAGTRDLTPWKGGGFGMFASVDRLSYRAMHGTFVTDDGEVALDVHGLADQGNVASKAFTNARALLDERRGSSLADVIASAAWTIDDGGIARFDRWLDDPTAGPLLQLDDEGATATVRALRLEVWAASHRRGTDELVPVRAGSYERVLAGAA